ncbi:MAG: leucine-rich repeat domain-containing protein, partial [Alphaproteobacteria bacterium]|nr:leucine-rich repeat domain-containing protein [Alphaproteobacteria bacterium]
MKKNLFFMLLFVLSCVFHFSCEALSSKDINEIKNKIQEKDKTANFLNIKVLEQISWPVYGNNYAEIWKKHYSQSTQYLIVPTINTNIKVIASNFPELRIVLNVDQNNYVSKTGELKLEANDISSIKNLWLTNIDESATCIAEGFLSKSNLQSITCDLPAIKEINNNFLDECRSLQMVNLTPLLKVTSIGNNFLCGCFKLTKANLPSSLRITQIGDKFLSCCSALQHIDLSSLSRITHIKDQFLSYCPSLKHINLSSLINVTHIGDYFLAGYKNYEQIDLSSLEKVTHIGNCFLYNYSIADPLSKLTHIIFPSSMSITHIGDYFLYGCDSLKDINLSFLTNITHIGDHFLYNCNILKELNLSFLKNITHIGNHFLTQCPNLTQITLSSLPKLTHIGDHFLSNCKTLKSVNISFLPQLTTIGSNFLNKCKDIKLINLSSVPQLSQIGNDSFLECYALCFGQIPKIQIGKVDKEEFSKFTALNHLSHNIEIILSDYINKDNNQKEVRSVFANDWDRIGIDRQQYISKNLTEKYGADHPRMQEIIKLTAIASNEQKGPLFVYKQLIEKLKENVIHHSKTIEIDHVTNNQKMIFEFDPNIFSYRPLTQKPLATDSQIYTILNNKIPKDIQKILKNSSFTTELKRYFYPPFTDTGIMLQAIIAKYATMREDEGRKRLCTLIQDLNQCGPGKKQVVLNTYTEEAIAEPLANIEHIKELLNSLNEYEENFILINRKRIKKETILDIINTMLKENHIFYNYMIDYTTKNSLKLKKLISQIVLINDKNDRIKQFCYIMHTLSSKISTFDKTIDDLCKIYDAYLPANKYGDSFDKDSIEKFIEMIDAKTIKDRWGENITLENVKQQLAKFVESSEFQHILNNFSDTIGYQLRELMDGFMRNGWYLGFLNLYETSIESNLSDAINATYQYVRLDKDISFDLNHLKDRILQDFDCLKIMGINLITSTLSGKQYNIVPHVSNYLLGLLGGVLGIRPITQLPAYDIY